MYPMINLAVEDINGSYKEIIIKQDPGFDILQGFKTKKSHFSKRMVVLKELELDVSCYNGNQNFLRLRQLQLQLAKSLAPEELNMFTHISLVKNDRINCVSNQNNNDISKITVHALCCME